MFSNEIKVNGLLIGHLYCHRNSGSPQRKFQYFYRYYRIEDGKVFEGYIVHQYEDGIEKLQSKIFDDIFTQIEE